MAAAVTRPPSALWLPSPLAQRLKPRRPEGVADALLETGRREIGQAPRMTQRRNRRSGVDVLMTPGQPRQRQIEKSPLVLINKTAVLLMHGEILAADDRGRAHRIGARDKHAERRLVLRREDRRRA